MRIAVVGGGAAGLAAAWRLHEQHEIVLYEREPWLGGHALTVDVPHGDGTVPVDTGFICYNEWIYPNLSALFRHLGVATEPTPPQTVSVDFPGGSWATGLDTPFARSIAAEVDRLMLELPLIVADPAGHAETTIGQYLEGRGYSHDFVHRCLVPVATERFVTPRQLLDLPVLDLAAGFGPLALYSLQIGTRWRVVSGGSRNYVTRLAAPFLDQVRLGTGVARIARFADHVEVTDTTGRTEAYDQVVLATPANVALRSLADPTPDETMLLGDVVYDPSTTILHSDPRVMPEDRRLWCGGTYVTEETEAPFRAAWSNYYMNATETWIPDDLDVFVSVHAPEDRIDPVRTWMRRPWQHIVADALHLLRTTSYHRIQGKRRTWYCGEYTGIFGGHEAALVSGLAVGVALGGSYPFPEDAAARRLFEEVAIRHMRVVDGTPPDPAATWWPPAFAHHNAHVVRQVVEREVRARLREVLPRPVLAALSAFGPLERALVGAIAGRVDLYAEARK